MDNKDIKIKVCAPGDTIDKKPGCGERYCDTCEDQNTCDTYNTMQAFLRMFPDASKVSKD